MSQKSSLTQSDHSVRQALTAYNNDYTHDSPSWFDHTLYFQGPRAGGKQGWVNIAIAAQPYELGDDDRAELAELQRQGYCIQIPPGGERESIWYPGQTLFIVVTLPGVTVKWLPEQL